MICKKESAGGCDTITADAIQISKTIPLHSRIAAYLLRVGTALATAFRGLA
jgi:hypothetical protein